MDNEKLEDKTADVNLELEQPKDKKPAKKKKRFFDTRLGRVVLLVIGVLIVVGALLIPGPTEPKLMGLSPLPAILLISIVLSFFVSLAYKFLTDQVLMRELKKDLRKYQNQMRGLRNEPEKMMEIQKLAMAANMKYMSQTMKPMLITIIPFLLIFTWLRGIYSGITVIPLSFWQGHLGWIGTYILFSMIFTTIIRKLLKVV